MAVYNANTGLRMGHVSRNRDPHQDMVYWLTTTNWPTGWDVVISLASTEESGDRGYKANVHGFDCTLTVTVSPLGNEQAVADPFPEIASAAETVGEVTYY